MAYINYLRGRANGRVVSTVGDLDPNTERARLTFHQANLAELDESEKRSDLVPREEVTEDIVTGMTNFRAKTLNLPTRLASLLAGTDDTHEIQAVLESACHEVLAELSNPYVKMEKNGPRSN